MTRVVVYRAGLLTTIQDEGRWGHQAAGVPVSGPMDGWSHRLANLLVGNGRGAPALEVTATGPDLRFEGPATIAIAGARFAGEIDDRRWSSPVVLEARAGSRLTFGARQHGLRAYIAAGGGFDAPLVLGSRATDVRSRLGGIAGRPLRDGDSLHVLGTAHAATRSVPPDAGWMLSAEPCRLRIMRGPEPGRAAEEAYEALLSSVFTVSPRSDRMGYHLAGAAVPIDAAPRISAPVATGVVQVPPDGAPVLLMSDRQTTGGYAPVAAVITADLPRAGQLGPGDRVAFDACEAEAALLALIASERTLLALEGR